MLLRQRSKILIEHVPYHGKRITLALQIWVMPQQGFMQNDTDREEISATIDVILEVTNLLGSTVAWRKRPESVGRLRERVEI